MSVGCCGPFDSDEQSAGSDCERLAIEAIEVEALRAENRFLRRELNATRFVIKMVRDQLDRLIEETK